MPRRAVVVLEAELADDQPLTELVDRAINTVPEATALHLGVDEVADAVVAVFGEVGSGRA